MKKDISHHCVNQSDYDHYIMTASLGGKDNLFTDYAISVQFGRAISSKHRNVICDHLAVLSTGRGSFLVHTITLSATTLELFFHLAFPNFVISYFYPLDTLWQNSRRIDLSGGYCSHFFEQGVVKN